MNMSARLDHRVVISISSRPVDDVAEQPGPGQHPPSGLEQKCRPNRVNRGCRCSPLDGHCSSRRSSSIRQPSIENLSYVDRVFDGVGHPSAPPPNLRLPGNLHWRDELIHVLATDDLIGVYEELRYPEVVQIGVYTGTNRRECGLLQVTPVGQWHDSDTLIKLSKITRIAIGGRYQDALARYGDSRPRGLMRGTVKDWARVLQCAITRLNRLC